MDFTINIQKLKKCTYMVYELATYDMDNGIITEDFEPYNPKVWDIETSKKNYEKAIGQYGGVYEWHRGVDSHSIKGHLLDIYIKDGMFHMNVDGNLVRIPVSEFDEFYELKNDFVFFKDLGGDYSTLILTKC